MKKTIKIFGITLGVLVGIFFVLYNSYSNSHSVSLSKDKSGKKKIKIELAEEVTFINKEPISNELDRLPNKAELEIDVRKTKFLDNDIVEIINDFLANSEEKDIQTRLISEKGVEENPKDISKLIAV